MSNVGAQTRAKATLHLTIRRANGTVEDVDVPAATDLTTDEVRALIVQQQAKEG
jgi:hypothetical protein